LSQSVVACVRDGCRLLVLKLCTLRQAKDNISTYFVQIRLQYEDYPEHTEQASRLVVLVQDVEIRDRLAHSQINKFLYQYTSEACPKQSHANMVRILDKIIVCVAMRHEVYSTFSLKRSVASVLL